MQDALFYIIISFIGMLLIAILVIPKYRRNINNLQDTRSSLEQRYAQQIADGTAIIIPKDPNAWKSLIFLMTCGAVFILLFQKFKIYISSLEQTCTTVGGWNSLFVNLGCIFIVGGIVLFIAVVLMYKNYKEIIIDGYIPARKSKESHDRIAFKLTRWLKIKEQLRLAMCFIFFIFLMSIPFQTLHILMNASPKKPISIFELNERLQKACLETIKK